MEFLTAERKLSDLVRAFNAGAILLPQFQRDYVWKPKAIRNLLDSLLKGFPIGAFYLWRPEESGGFKPKHFGKQKFAPLFQGYLIDGQQRLTSLEAAYGLYTGEDKGGAALECYLDLAARDDVDARDTRLFVTRAGNKTIAARISNGDSTLLPLTRVLAEQKQDLRAEIEGVVKVLPGWDKQRFHTAMERLDRAFEMLDQRVPCTTIEKVGDAEAVEVFRRLNKGGRALSEGDVRAAELARGPAVKVLTAMRDFVNGEMPQRLGFGFNFAFRALVVFHRQSAQFSRLKADWMDMPGPHKRTLAQSWAATREALERAFEFVDKKMGWSRRALVPSSNAIIVLAAAFEKDATLNAKATGLYRRWLCLASLRGVFQGSVETTINRFTKAVRESKAHPSTALVKALKKYEGARIRPDELDTYSQLWAAPTLVLHSWLVHIQARDWLSGDTIDALARSQTVGHPAGELTVHHIFSRKLAATNFEDPDEANAPANFALLSRSTNSEFKEKDPIDILGTLNSKQRKSASAQFFSDDAGDLLKPENYDDFCDWRAKRLANALNDYLGFPPT